MPQPFNLLLGYTQAVADEFCKVVNILITGPKQKTSPSKMKNINIRNEFYSCVVAFSKKWIQLQNNK